MDFFSNAQALYVIDPSSPASQLPVDDTSHATSEPAEHGQFLTMPEEHIEVGEPGEIEIIVEELPGAPAGTKDPEPILEVSEEQPEDSNEAKKDDKSSKWNWSDHGKKDSEGFVAWIKERLSNVPKHSGFDSSGLQRASAYLDKLDNEISKAMRLDLDGELDANMIEKVRSEIDEGMARLQSRMEKVNKTKKSNRKKKAEYEMDEDGFIKEAQKITGVQGIYVTVPLLISRIARICVNGSISAGHSIADLYHRQVEKYALNEREQAEVVQLIEDMGYAIRWDRGYFSNESFQPSSSDNYDWASNTTDN